MQRVYQDCCLVHLILRMLGRVMVLFGTILLMNHFVQHQGLQLHDNSKLGRGDCRCLEAPQGQTNQVFSSSGEQEGRQCRSSHGGPDYWYINKDQEEQQEAHVLCIYPHLYSRSGITNSESMSSPMCLNFNFKVKQFVHLLHVQHDVEWSNGWIDTYPTFSYTHKLI